MGLQAAVGTCARLTLGSFLKFEMDETGLCRLIQIQPNLAVKSNHAKSTSRFLKIFYLNIAEAGKS